MKLKDISIGQAVKVRRGYSIRPATVTHINPNGRVEVSFTDTKGVNHATWANRQNYFGATVRCNQLEAN